VILLLLAALAGTLAAQSPAERRAIDLLEKGRVEEATRVLTEALRAEPKSPSINGLLGQIAFSRKDYAAAAKLFAAGAPFLEGNPLLLVNYAEALLETKAPAAALRALEKLPARDAVAQFEAGLLLARFGQFTAAERRFELALPGYPQPQVLKYNLGLAQYRAGKFAASAATLETVRKHNPDDGDVLNLLGQAYLDAGEADKALAVLQEATRKNMRDERNYMAIGKLAIDEDLAAAGLEALDRGVAELPQSYALRVQRGYLRLSQGLHAEAEADYREATALKPDSETPKIGLAFVLLQSQRQPEAAKLLEQVLASSQSFFAHYLMGEVRTREGLDDEAIRNLRKSVDLEPRFGPARANLGKLYLKKNETPAAIRELEAAVKLDPEDTTAYYQLSIAYRRTGEKEKAQKALAQVKELNKEQRELGATRFITRKLRKLRSTGGSPF